MEPEFIDTTTALEAFLASLEDPVDGPTSLSTDPSTDAPTDAQTDAHSEASTEIAPANPRILYLDLEGSNLGRHGTLSLITILDPQQQRTALIDVTTLQHTAFTTTTRSGLSLQNVLEARQPTKVLFDVRNDSDALFSLHGIRLAGVEDLQLQELAARTASFHGGGYVCGLAKCIERDAELSAAEKAAWKAGKERGHALFAPERGGSYAVFDARPLAPEVLAYCVQDVVVMPNLREVYLRALGERWRGLVAEETVARIALSQSPGYNGKGRHMAKGPESWGVQWPEDYD